MPLTIEIPDADVLRLLEPVVSALRGQPAAGMNQPVDLRSTKSGFTCQLVMITVVLYWAPENFMLTKWPDPHNLQDLLIAACRL